MLKKILIGLAVLAGVFLSFFVVIYLCLKSPRFFASQKPRIQQILAEHGVDLDFDSLSIDLFGTFETQGLDVKMKDEVALSLESLKVEFAPFALLTKTLHVKSVSMGAVDVTLDLPPSDPSDPAPPPESGEPDAAPVSVPDLIEQLADFFQSPPASLKVDSIQTAAISMNVRMQPDMQLKIVVPGLHSQLQVAPGLLKAFAKTSLSGEVRSPELNADLDGLFDLDFTLDQSLSTSLSEQVQNQLDQAVRASFTLSEFRMQDQVELPRLQLTASAKALQLSMEDLKIGQDQLFKQLDVHSRFRYGEEGVLSLTANSDVRWNGDLLAKQKTTVIDHGGKLVADLNQELLSTKKFAKWIGPEWGVWSLPQSLVQLTWDYGKHPNVLHMVSPFETQLKGQYSFSVQQSSPGSLLKLDRPLEIKGSLVADARQQSLKTDIHLPHLAYEKHQVNALQMDMELLHDGKQSLGDLIEANVAVQHLKIRSDPWVLEPSLEMMVQVHQLKKLEANMLAKLKGEEVLNLRVDAEDAPEVLRADLNIRTHLEPIFVLLKTQESLKEIPLNGGRFDTKIAIDSRHGKQTIRDMEDPTSLPLTLRLETAGKHFTDLNGPHPLLNQLGLETVISFQNETLKLERFLATLNDSFLQASLQGEVQVKTGEGTLDGQVDLEPGSVSIPDLRGAGTARFPFAVSSTPDLEVELGGTAQFEEFSLQFGEMEVAGLDGFVSVKEKLQVIREPSWMLGFRYLIDKNPFERVDFNRQEPLYHEEPELFLEKARFQDKVIGPLSLKADVEQNILFLKYMNGQMFGGSFAGAAFVNFHPQMLRLGLLGRAVKIKPELISDQEARETSDISSRIAVELDLLQYRLDGRIDVTEIGKPQLLGLMRVLDPQYEDSNLNLARKGLMLAYPEYVGLNFNAGNVQMDVRLGGLISKEIRVPNLPVTPLFQSAAAPAVDQILKLPISQNQ